jgi:hypothetical protein
LEKGEADWQPADHAIWLREWLAYGVKEVPNLYNDNDRPENSNSGASDEKRGVKVKLQGTWSLQTPALFDFRTDQDHGITLQKVK